MMPCLRTSVFGVCLMLPLMFVSAAETGADAKRLGIGERASDFDLSVVGADGFVRLQDEYRRGPVVVIVLRGYPGYQCPLCSQQISSLINRAAALAKETHRVILVYPGEAKLLDRYAKRFIGSRSLPDPLVIVRDDDMKMVSEWGLRWNAPRETAYPATYVIDRNGRVRWFKVSDNHSGRSSVTEILRELKKL